MDINRYKPAAGKKVLILLAGLMWALSGIMLLSLAARWISAAGLRDKATVFSAGFVLSMIIHHFGFLRIVDRNLERLLPVSERRCIFSFMPLKSWLIIPVMAAMGMLVRHSGLPKPYMSVIYSAIGIALFLSGIRYFRHFIMLPHS